LALHKDWLVPLAKAVVRHKLKGTAYALGDQQVFLTEQYARSQLQRRNLLVNPQAPFKPDHINPDLVSFETALAMLGIERYRDVDLNPRAALTLDLSSPLPAEHAGVADIVLDLGTAEHIFDTAQVFSNIVELLAPGGWVIHFSPMTWYNHGFINFNPLFFPEFYQYNGFQVLEHGIIVTPFTAAFGFFFGSAAFRTRFTRSSRSPVSFYVRADKYSFRILNEKFFQFPRNIIFFVARKGSSCEPARFPIQGRYRHLDPTRTG